MKPEKLSSQIQFSVLAVFQFCLGLLLPSSSVLASRMESLKFHGLVQATGSPVAQIKGLLTLANGDLAFAGTVQSGGASIDTMKLAPIPETFTGNFVGLSDSQGRVKWVKMLGPGMQIRDALGSDSQGNILVGGTVYCASRKYVIGPDTIDATKCGDSFLVIKLSPKGEILWARDWPANNTGPYRDARLTAMTVGPDGAAYVAGWAPAEIWPATKELVSVFFVARFDAQGNRSWRRILKNEFEEGGFDPLPGLKSISIDPAGRIYAAGWFKGAVHFSRNGSSGYDSIVSAGNEDLCVFSYSPNGNLRFGKRLGGTERDFSNLISASAHGFRVAGNVNGVGRLDSLEQPGDPESKIIARFDTLGRPQGYLRVPATDFYSFISWASLGDTLHTLLGGGSAFAYARIASDRVLSIEPLEKGDIPGKPAADAELQLESIAVLASGKPILSGSWSFQGNIPNQFQLNAFVIQGVDPLPVTMERVQRSDGAALFAATKKRDLLGRLVAPSIGLQFQRPLLTGTRPR